LRARCLKRRSSRCLSSVTRQAKTAWLFSFGDKIFFKHKPVIGPESDRLIPPSDSRIACGKADLLSSGSWPKSKKIRKMIGVDPKAIKQCVVEKTGSESTPEIP
jgi:hypothetical protein